MTFQKKYYSQQHYPSMGSAEEKDIFIHLQHKFSAQFQQVFPDRLAQKTVVIIPSLTLDKEILSKVKGHIYYEERLLCLLMLLKMPETHVIYITSVPVDPVIVDYYIHLLPGITGNHARKRLHMLSCYDASSKPLTEKILERPRLIYRIKELIADTNAAHMSCFNVTAIERSLALKLNIPIYGCDPDLFRFGTKTGGRLLFKKCGITVPKGFENLKNEDDLFKALATLKMENPFLKRAVIKLEDGFSGDGNAVFTYPTTDILNIEEDIRISFHTQLQVVATNIDANAYLQKFNRMGGIAEEFIDAIEKTSPSVQCRINPIKESEIISTHDKLLGGADNQVFIGAYFPANEEYAKDISTIGKIITDELSRQGALGRFSIDFISVKEQGEWKHYAIEINLRKGGTTHPFLLLQFLTDGIYRHNHGDYITASGNKRFYLASDNVENEKFKGLTPHDLLDIVIHHELMYDATKQEGIMFHLMGALSQYGKLGILSIGSTKERATEFFEKIISVLNQECEL